MKLAYLASRYPAPSHTFIRREIEALRRRGFEIATFSIRRPSAAELAGDADRREHDGTEYILPSGPVALLGATGAALLRGPSDLLRVMGLALGHRPSGLKGLAYAFIYLAEAMLLAHALRQSGATRLHVHFANPAAIVGLLASRLLKLPYSLTLHGISEFDYPAGLLLRGKVEAAQFVACASWFVRAQAMRLTPSDQWHKFKVVRCGLDLPDFPLVARTRREAGPAELICVGRLSAEKGQLGLLEVVASLGPRDLRLTLIGDGPMRGELETAARRLGLGARVQFLGARSEEFTRAAIARSDLLVLSSFMEGLPVVLMEAMACGVPVIAPRVAGIPELVTDGEEGLLFCPSDWDDLTRKIHLAIKDRERAEAMSPWARAKIEREFDINEAAARLAALFEGPDRDADVGPSDERP